MIARGSGKLPGDSNGDPKPYKRVLEAVLVVGVPSGKVVLSLDADDACCVTGAMEHLAVLADVVRDLSKPSQRPRTAALRCLSAERLDLVDGT